MWNFPSPLYLFNLFVVRSYFRDNLAEWRSYYDDVAPHEADLPQAWNMRLNDFQKMIVLRCIRPDKVSRFCQKSNYVINHQCWIVISYKSN